ncbi:hypothetical protein DEH81_07600 [Pectobacterium zantedeschiae]|nr:hypothetical protein DEH81_07600 [Pectobacterium zantedeschiae]
MRSPSFPPFRFKNDGRFLFCLILVILQIVCALATFKYSARRRPRPEGPLQAAFKSAPGRFVTRITYLCKLIGIK